MPPSKPDNPELLATIALLRETTNQHIDAQQKNHAALVVWITIAKFTTIAGALMVVGLLVIAWMLGPAIDLIYTDLDEINEWMSGQEHINKSENNLNRNFNERLIRLEGKKEIHYGK